VNVPQENVQFVDIELMGQFDLELQRVKEVFKLGEKFVLELLE